MMKRALVVTGLILAVAIGGTARPGPIATALRDPPPAFARRPPLPANALVVAGGLVSPRGFTFAPDGALIVAESGAPPPGFQAPGGPPTPDYRPGTSFSGRVSRVDPATGQ